MADCSSKHKNLSLDEVIAEVLQSDEEQELSEFEECIIEIRDFEGEEGNEHLLVMSQIQITFVHLVDRDTHWLMMTMQMKMIMLTVKQGTHCLQPYILSETNFPRDINVIFYSILQLSSDSFTLADAIINDGETSKSLDDISDHSATDVDTDDNDNDIDKFALGNKERGLGERVGQVHGQRAGRKSSTNCKHGVVCGFGKGLSWSQSMKLCTTSCYMEKFEK